ncbi:receptor-like serine/threonine-protein kinase SD1-6 [Carya illinoinensis]|uniref:Receptor-like serine/threonine-protein kinase n=2 Tax=Carya illinoinensis TaxID=32201 RepID=A0A922JLD6_CARIL|nr:receptor-like serine/threonine-protein kinase SD1-6 [Carya illinoinensis]KAG6709387.1 hypothetical protein I3842_06G130600 [Carya illinoinensis]
MLVRDMGLDGTRPFLLFVLLLFLRACFSVNTDDTFSKGQSLSAMNTDSISSKSGRYELGFFERGTPPKFYLGIWFKRLVGQKIVWVANRENHLSDPSTSRLEFSEDGNLVLLEASSKKPFWSTNLENLPSNSTEAALLDDGNFVLRDRSNLSTIFWESFDHPTDTWMPGGKLGIDKAGKVPKQLISWKNSDDPSLGPFSLSLRIYPNGSSEFILQWNRSQVYWSTGVWNGETFGSLPWMRSNPIYNYSFVSNANETYFNYSLYNSSMMSISFIDSTGQLEQKTWLSANESKSDPWDLLWANPKSLSDVYALCGAFGIYHDNTSHPCDCPKGFEPFSDTQTTLNDWSSGCLRRHPLQCENRNAKKDWFQKIPNITSPINWKAYSAVSARRCELACMNNCSCTAYTHNSSGCLIWEGALLNMQQPSDGGEAGQDIYLRLSADEPQISTKGTKWKVWVIVAVLVAATGLILCLSVCFSIKRKLKHKGETAASSNDLMLFDLSTEIHAISDGTNCQDSDKKRGKKDVELPLFSYESVLAATDNFSTANKLGEGGFGPVYKGKLLRGQEIAVKMLSKRSGQGIEEFRNETTLIAKLQHRNLVKLLGCCIEGDEKILIYEYMPNKSLDFYLFDPAKKQMLDWGTRIHIIEGIAQGLLYLHQYSRLRIIHRDMKPSNILLDSEMNPKISDFGMARIVGDNELQANTNRIVGTFGYMSPEYAMEGLYSIKSDVFSFGVLLLEIVSGKKNTGFYNHGSLNLLGYAWELWRDDQSLELMDSTIGYPTSTSILVRYINIGLLCVQENPVDRPTMLDVVSMISNEHVPLLTPKQPAFTVGRNPTINLTENCSINSVTFSVMEAR